MLIGHLKNRLVKCLLEKNDSKREQLLNEIIEDAIHSRVPIRPGRSFKRKNIDKKNFFEIKLYVKNEVQFKCVILE